MSTKTRNEEQKIRRRYLDDCKKQAKRPMTLEEWRKAFAKKTKVDGTTKSKTKAVAKTDVAKKDASKKNVPSVSMKHHNKVEVHNGDYIDFVGFSDIDVIFYCMNVIDEIVARRFNKKTSDKKKNGDKR